MKITQNKQIHKTNKENRQTKRAADNDMAVGMLWWRKEKTKQIPDSQKKTRKKARQTNKGGS